MNIQDATKYFNMHKSVMLKEVQKNGYKKTAEALQKLAKAFDNDGDIYTWTSMVKYEMLCEIFGLKA